MGAKKKKILTHFKKHDPVIYEQMLDINFNEWFRETRKDEYFSRLCFSIISQQLATAAAKAIKKRFVGLFADKQINAKNVLKLEDQKIRDIGVSWSKIAYIKDLSEKHMNEEIDLNNISELSNEDIVDELTKVKGIGVWTAEMFMMFTLGREDIFSYGDLGLRKGFEKLYEINEPTDKQIGEVVSKWKPFRTYGCITLWNYKDSNF